MTTSLYPPPPRLFHIGCPKCGGAFYGWKSGQEVEGPKEPEEVSIDGSIGRRLWTWIDRETGERCWNSSPPSGRRRSR